MKKWIVVAAVVVLGVGYASTRVCLSAVMHYGLWLDHCPDGQLRQTVWASSSGLMRGEPATLYVQPYTHYTWGPSDTAETETLKEFSVEASLHGPGVDQVLTPKEPWAKSTSGKWGEITLPKVNDGDYTLKTVVRSTIGESTLEMPMPLYAPARIHLITDRPLYEPGNTVQFRALLLKAADLSPLDGRPGTFAGDRPAGRRVARRAHRHAGAMGEVVAETTFHSIPKRRPASGR